MSNDRTPLLRGYVGGASEAPENDTSSKFPITARVLRLGLVGTLVALVVSFIAVVNIQRPGDSATRPAIKETICTSAGCVLASATLLRSLSPRQAYRSSYMEIH